MTVPAIGQIDPVLVVTNAADAQSYYTDKLGFSVSFAWQDADDEPVRYVILARDTHQIHLTEHSEPRPAITYLFCHHIGALYDEMLASGADIHSELQHYPWDMMEFEVQDPDGNRLIFGESVSPQDDASGQS